MMAGRRDSTLGVKPYGTRMWAYTYLSPNDLHWPWHGHGQNGTDKCQNGKIVHTHLGRAPFGWEVGFAHVVCELWGPMCISYIPHMVHWSMRLACTGGLKIVQVERKI